MKKFISCIVIVAVLVAAGSFLRGSVEYGDISAQFFGKRDNSAIKAQISERLNTASYYPYYHSLTEADKDIYAELCTAIECFDYRAEFGKFSTAKEAKEMYDRVSEIYFSMIYEQPQYFWVDPYVCNYYLIEGYGNRLSVLLNPIADEAQIEQKKSELNAKVSEIVTQAETMESTYEKVLYVYDEILKITEYDYELSEMIDETYGTADEESDDATDISQTVYGCLVEGKTVCSGYALAFNLIMQELGYACGAVANREINSDSESERVSHVSNYCKLDGEYYYFDLTWDDTEFEEDLYKKYFDFSHSYFAITSEEFEETHEITEDAYAPEGTATEYNYFVYNDRYFEKYSYKAVKNSVSAQRENGYIELKFGSYAELEKAKKDLIDNEKIFNIIKKDECTYVIPDVGAYMYVLF